MKTCYIDGKYGSTHSRSLTDSIWNTSERCTRDTSHKHTKRQWLRQDIQGPKRKWLSTYEGTTVRVKTWLLTRNNKDQKATGQHSQSA